MRLIYISLLCFFYLSQIVSNCAHSAPYYEDKIIRMVIGYSAGGGYDLYARLLAHTMPKYIEGEPHIIIQNMPGAGSLLATNWLYNVAPRDGTIIASINRGIAFEPLTGGEGVQFNPLKFGWLGSLSKEVNVTIAWHTSKIHSANDLIKYEFIAGGTGSGADSAIYPALMNRLLGAHIKLITGYPGANDVNMAMEKGEIEGRPSPSWSSIKSAHMDWVRDHTIIPLWQLSLTKHPELPDVPLAIDFAQTAEDRKVLEYFFARQDMSRPFLTTPEVKKERLALLRKAFMQSAEDPEFLKSAQELDLDIDPISGMAIDELLKHIFASPKKIIERVHEIEKESITKP
jgi:tripartite-type tricarboxylate transporter receptor subunit TctC